MSNTFCRCTIDFLSSPEIGIGQDIMFHTSIRLDEKCMVRNAFINHRWGPEERYGQFRISYNDPFEIIFLAEFEHYKIAVNGTHIGVFRHRLPLHLVNFIQVTGNVHIDHIVLEQDLQSAQVHQAISAITSTVTAAAPGNSNVYKIQTQPPQYPPPSAPPIHVTYQPPNYQQQQQQNRYPF